MGELQSFQEHSGVSQEGVKSLKDSIDAIVAITELAKIDIVEQRGEGRGASAGGGRW